MCVSQCVGFKFPAVNPACSGGSRVCCLEGFGRDEGPGCQSDSDPIGRKRGLLCSGGLGVSGGGVRVCGEQFGRCGGSCCAGTHSFGRHCAPLCSGIGAGWGFRLLMDW